MIRWISFGSVWCVLMAATPADLFGQFNPYGNRLDPYVPGADPRVRRAQREQAVTAIGPIARDFVETQGDEAVAALFACSRPVAVKLVEFYASGEMAKLPRPRDLLFVIAQPRHGDEVALFAIHHAHELTDTDCFDAYLLNPLEYAMRLKQLSAGAAEVRARRQNPAAMTTPPLLSANEKLGIAATVLFFVGLLAWRRRQSAIC